MRLRILGPLAIAGVIAITSAFGTTFADGEATDADLSLTKHVSDDSVEVGETVTFTLVVSNTGPATSTAVTLTDPLPDALDFVSVTSDSGVCGEASGVVTCNLGQLDVGQTATSTIVAIAIEAGEVTNTATVFGAQHDPDDGDNSDSATVEIGDVSADLSIAKVASDDEVLVGDIVVFTIQVRNHGPATSTNVTITDALPSNLDFLAAVSTTGVCSETANVVTCELGELGDGEGAVVFIDAEATAAGESVNVASVEGDEHDPDESDNTAAATLMVISMEPEEVDLSMTKTASDNHVLAGEHVVFTLQISNVGLATSTDVIVTDTLPSRLAFVSAESTVGACGESGGVVTCELGDLGAGEGAEITVEVEALRSGMAVNTAEVSGNETDADDSDNSDSASVEISALSGSGIDIKPGSDRNPLNLNGRGVVPVLLFGGDGFDVHDIDISSIRFGFDGDEARPAHGGHIGDVSGDGIDDLMLHFRRNTLGMPHDLFKGEVVTLTLTGEMTDGTEFQEEDTVTIVGKPPRFQNSDGGPELFPQGAKGKSKGKSKGPKNKGPKGKGHGPRW